MKKLYLTSKILYIKRMNLRKNKDDLAKDKKLLHKYIYNNNDVFFLKWELKKIQGTKRLFLRIEILLSRFYLNKAEYSV